MSKCTLLLTDMLFAVAYKFLNSLILLPIMNLANDSK